jgi:hypothetical protein
MTLLPLGRAEDLLDAFGSSRARDASLPYYERFHDPAMFAPAPKGTVPTGVAVSQTPY